jgi:hypothetical protein
MKLILNFVGFKLLSAAVFRAVMRRMSRRDEMTGGEGGENCIMRSFVICTLRQV